MTTLPELIPPMLPEHVEAADEVRKSITREQLRAELRYEPETGEFYRVRRSSNRIKADDIAGGIDAYGYRVIRIFGVMCKALRFGANCVIAGVERVPTGNNADDKFLAARLAIVGAAAAIYERGIVKATK